MSRGWHTFRIPHLLLILVVVAFAPFLASRGLCRRAQAGGELHAVDLQGRRVDPLAASRGRVVVLVFVRTDCPVSNRYAPAIQRLSARYAGKADFWLVYPDKDETAAMIRKHEKNYGYRLVALRDPQRALVKESQAQITPEAAVFDPRGRLAYHGRIDNLYEDFGHARQQATTHELDDAIEAAIGGKTPTVATAPAVGCYISDLE